MARFRKKNLKKKKKVKKKAFNLVSVHLLWLFSVSFLDCFQGFGSDAGMLK